MPAEIEYNPGRDATTGTGQVYDIADYGYNYGSGADASTAIVAAFAALKTANGGTYASGTLRISGPTDIATAVSLDGGVVSASSYSTSDWLKNPPAVFRFEGLGAINCHASLGAPALTFKGFIEPSIYVRLREGGAYRRVTDATATNASSTIGSATATFVTADTGRYVRVEGAGYTGGADVPLDGVFTRTNATSGTVATYTAAATVSGKTLSIMDIGVHIENCYGPTVDIIANNYAGLVLHMDTANSTSALFAINLNVRQLHVSNCGQSIAWHDQGSAGHIEDVYDVGCQCGAVLDNISDLTLGQWDTYSPATQNCGLIAYNANSWSMGTLSFGDRPTDALIKFVGGNVGSASRIRVGGQTSITMGNAVIDGLTLVDVTSMHIADLNTKYCAKGLHIKGGGGAAVGAITVRRHQSLTIDTVPVYIEAGPATTAPNIDLTGSWRNHANQTVYIASSVTGGIIGIHGLIDTPNGSGAGSIYAIDCQATGPTVDISGLRDLHRNTLAGTINHATIGNIQGIAQATLDRPPFLTPGVLTENIAQVAVGPSSNTETALVTYTVGANLMQAGSHLRIVAGGQWDNVASSGSLTWRTRWGGVAGTSIGVATFGSQTVGTGKFWKIIIDLVFRAAPGASVTVQADGMLIASPGATGFSTTTSVATNASKDLVLDFVWATSDAANVVRCEHATIECVKS